MNWRKNMGPLDFSKFSVILLEAPDGDIRPQSEPYFKATQLADGVWQVLSDGDHIYVLEGDDELICIDSTMAVSHLAYSVIVSPAVTSSNRTVSISS